MARRLTVGEHASRGEALLPGFYAGGRARGGGTGVRGAAARPDDAGAGGGGHAGETRGTPPLPAAPHPTRLLAASAPQTTDTHRVGAPHCPPRIDPKGRP